MYKPVPVYDGPSVSLDPSKLSPLSTAVAADEAATRYNLALAEVREHNALVYNQWAEGVKASAKNRFGRCLLTDAWFKKYRDAIGYPWSYTLPTDRAARIEAILAARETDRLKKEAAEEKALSASLHLLAEASKLGVEREAGETASYFSERVWEKAREVFLEENFPDGEEVEISCCDECSSWTVGERRCSCGNVRVELDLESVDKDDISKGFFCYPVRY